MTDGSYLIRAFTPPPSPASGPAFTCPQCDRRLLSHEWTKDHESASADRFELRCGCGRRYRWRRGGTFIETVLTQWYRQHATGEGVEAILASSGWFDYGIRRPGAEATEWLGQTRLVDKARLLADAAVATHVCTCPEWRGEP